MKRPDTWMPFDPMRWSELPAAPGVYVILLDGQAVYIGQSNNLRSRLQRHAIRYGYGSNIITPWGRFADDTVIAGKFRGSRCYGDWAMRELRLIRRLRPRFNGTFVNARRAAA